MRSARVILLSLMLRAAFAQAQNVPSNEYPKQAFETNNQNEEAPRPVAKYRGLKIALGVVGGLAVLGAIVGIAVANSSSNNQTGYNDWGTLVLERR